MFDIISKEEYWRWIDHPASQPKKPPLSKRDYLGRKLSPLTAALKGIHLRMRRFLSPPRPYELKHVQDAFLLSRLAEVRGAKILEVGGGNSRILPILTACNECWTVDRFEGRYGGPKRAPRLPHVKTVHAYMGGYSPQLPNAYFDFVVSISVVEHVPLVQLEAFFEDCTRVLKPGGRMIHAIDTYLFDAHELSVPPDFKERIDAYLTFAYRPDLGIRLVEEPKIDKDVEFSCRYASLPDNVLHKWNLNRPSMKRVVGQVVSIKAEWIKSL